MKQMRGWMLAGSILSVAAGIGVAQPVAVGADLLCSERMEMLKGKRCALVVNHTARIADGRHLVDALRAGGTEIVRLFGPEHGVRGIAAAGEKIVDGVDSSTGIPVISLYGRIQKPAPEMLRDVDVLIYDIQDVGARFYTYISTMAYCLEAAAERGIPFVVLDRPNPLGGDLIDGPLLEDSLRSFVGVARIPVVYGLTAGELAGYLVGERCLAGGIRPELTVVPMRGWKRSMRWTETGLPWIAPSPNLPSPASATVYPATCFLEATNLSEGRGTRRPFETFGGPFVDPVALVKELTGVRIPGARFDTVSFTPETSKHAGVPCRGAVMEVDPDASWRPVEAGLRILRAIMQTTPKCEIRRRGFVRLMGSSPTYDQLMAGVPTPEIIEGWKRENAEFALKRGKYLLYR